MVEVNVWHVTKDINQNWNGVIDVGMREIDRQFRESNVALHSRIRLPWPGP